MKKNKTILYISYDGMTDSLGQSQVLSYMQKLASGYRISILSFEKEERYAALKKDISAICSSSGIEWVPLSYTKSPPVLSTVYDIMRMRKAASKICKEKNVSIVHCRSYISALTGLWLKKKYAVKFIFDMRGFWIDERVEAGYWNPANFIYKAIISFFRKKEKQFYEESDTIVTLTHASAEVIKTINPAFKLKLKVIPTCVNLDVFSAYNAGIRSEIRKKMGIPEDAFVLLYSGGFGANYDISFFLRVYAEVKLHKDNVCILVLSKDGVTGFEKEKEAGQIFSISLNYLEVGNYLMAGDLGVINYANQFSVSARSPTKLGEYWACGLPAVAPPGVGDVDHLFDKYKGAGIIFNPEIFGNELQKVLQTSKHELRLAAAEYFGLDNGTVEYNNVYEQLSPVE